MKRRTGLAVALAAAIMIGAAKGFGFRPEEKPSSFYEPRIVEIVGGPDPNMHHIALPEKPRIGSSDYAIHQGFHVETRFVEKSSFTIEDSSLTAGIDTPS